ncbi:substrate-binding domain-containing protein [Ideonella azotifigens]|uniref:substrate-binding domain-containing protein n=1 Tax=Ideonella azotifigens TaxID=513160 RepID=UPI001E2A5F0F|nr:substrate-binding domain-containing protein [Ideonella azotifigens]MCD2342683.1 substrate-binding domain-containing protein [Ideonella azotifigens]
MAFLSVAAALAALSTSVAAQEAPPKRTELRVCQDPNNLPFSNTKGEGIENRIAEVFGKALNLPVTYYSFPQRLAFVRNTLRYKLPGQDYPCDIIIGVPVGFDEGVSVTKPYYRSTYALVFPRGKGLDDVTTVDAFLALGPEKLRSLRIGVYDRSPAGEWLSRHQLLENGVPYQMMNADPQQYPGEIIEKDLAQGKLDAAIVWGPIAGYFAQRVKSPQLVVLPLKSEPGLKLDYQMAMGVRFGEREWKQQVEGLIESRQAEIETILKAYGVPMVDASYRAPKN